MQPKFYNLSEAGKSRNSYGLIKRTAYIKQDSDEIEEPCLLIDRPRADLKACFVIPLSCGFKYVPSNKAEVAAAFFACLGPATMLGLISEFRARMIINAMAAKLPSAATNEEKRMLAQVTNFIADGLDEIIKMPPRIQDRKVIGEGELLDHGEKVGRFDITDDMVD